MRVRLMNRPLALKFTITVLTNLVFVAIEFENRP